jgi:20S proteasome alpha/beta subunit
MTIIAWDGMTLAADKRASSGSLILTTTKIRRVRGCLVGWTGDQDSGELMARWLEDGADLKAWPESQKDKEIWSRLIVIDKVGARFYERLPVSIAVEDKFAAWGSGRDFAYAAMHLGKSAREAVEVACVFDSACGNGVDELRLV